MESKDLTRFKHMFDCTKAVLSFAQGRTRTDLDKDRQFLSAVLRELEVLGEAANNISPTAKKQFPEFPWKEMVGMRNRLIEELSTGVERFSAPDRGGKFLAAPAR